MKASPLQLSPALVAILLGAPFAMAQQEGPLTDDDLGDPNVAVQTETSTDENGNVTTETATTVESDPAGEQAELAEPGDSSADDSATEASTETTTSTDGDSGEQTSTAEANSEGEGTATVVVQGPEGTTVVTGAEGQQPDSTEVDNPGADSSADSVATVLNGDPRFSTLIALIQEAQLESGLAELLPVTIFAPTNEAFEALGEGSLNNLMSEDNQHDLRDVLLHHIVSGAYTTGELEEGQLTTAMGENLQFMNADGRATVDGATIIEANLMADDGVVQVIDKVLLPLSLRDPKAAAEHLARDNSETQSAIDAELPEQSTVTTETEVETNIDEDGNTTTETENSTRVDSE